MVAVSVILPIYNAERWLNECLESIFNQTYDQSFELCVHNDCSTDRTLEIVSHWTPKFLQRNVEVILTNSESKIGPLGMLRNYIFLFIVVDTREEQLGG